MYTASGIMTPQWLIFKIHACWLDKDCRSVPTPAHTYITVFGRTIRINPPYSNYYLKGELRTGKLRFGRGFVWRPWWWFQYIGKAKTKAQIAADIAEGKEWLRRNPRATWGPRMIQERREARQAEEYIKDVDPITVRRRQAKAWRPDPETWTTDDRLTEKQIRERWAAEGWEPVEGLDSEESDQDG
jgi:hypothetical protein